MKSFKFRTILILMVILLYSVFIFVSESTQSYALNDKSKPEIDSVKVFQAWAHTENMAHLSEFEKIALHDLVIEDTWIYNIGWNTNDEQPYNYLATTLDPTALENAKRMNDELRNLNPKIKVICSLNYREGKVVKEQDDLEYWEKGDLPIDSKYWLKDGNGDIVPGWGEDVNGDGTIELSEIELGLIDFTNESFQALVVERVETLKDSGLFDGVFFDWWSEMDITTGNLDFSETYISLEDEIYARVALLEKIRDAVGSEFLILVNSNQNKVPQSANYINGIFMECYKPEYSRGYTQLEMNQIESTLKWAEISVQEPRINCIEGWRKVEDYNGSETVRIIERNTPESIDQMTNFTAMSLALSEGYVLFGDDNAMPSEDHLHNWYDLWSLEIGKKVEGASDYLAEEGLKVKVFEYVYAVYNDSDQSKFIVFQTPVRSYGGVGNSRMIKIKPHTGMIFHRNES